MHVKLTKQENSIPHSGATYNRRKMVVVLFIVLICILVITFILDLVLGSVSIPFSDVFTILSGGNSKPEWSTILLDFRLPKAISAVLAGSALAVSGIQMQTVFRNPLAGPYVLGISSGASLGVAIFILGLSSLTFFTMPEIIGSWVVILAAWCGAGLILLLILAISLRVKDIMTILILGIMFGAVTGALVTVLQYFSSDASLKTFVIWTMGSLGRISGTELKVLIPCIIVGLGFAFFSSKILNALLLGENTARTLGIGLKRSRVIIFISTSLLAGSITAFCGPIAFIGIIIPHISRMVFRTSDHKILIPACILIGAIFMLFSDIFAQLPGNNKVLPINSVTALLGIPIVIWIVIRNYRISFFR